MILNDPFETLLSLQRELDQHYDSAWLGDGPTGRGPYPPINVFRKGDDFIVIAEIPGVAKCDLNIQAKQNVIRIAGTKAVDPPNGASVHRRERASGEFDRTITLPVEIDANRIKAEYRDGILAMLVPRAEHDKPKIIAVS